MDALIGDRFLKHFLKGFRPGAKTGSTAAAPLQDLENNQGPAWDDGESHNEPQALGKKGLSGPLPELSGGTEMDGDK